MAGTAVADGPGLRPRHDRVQELVFRLIYPSAHQFEYRRWSRRELLTPWVPHFNTWPHGRPEYPPSRDQVRAGRKLVRIGAPALPYLVRGLAVENPEGRLMAIAVLGAIRDCRAVAPLLTVLRWDELWEARATAAEALARIRDSRAVEPLIEAARPTRYGINLYAVRALRVFPTPEVIRFLRGLLGQTIYLRWAWPSAGQVAAEALGEMGRPGLPALLAGARSCEAETRLNAASGLMRVAEPAAWKEIRVLLAREPAEVRRKLVQRLGQAPLRTTEASLDVSPRLRELSLDLLVEALCDRESRVREAAQASAYHFGYALLTPAERSVSSEWSERREVVAILARCPHGRGVPSLVRLLTGPDMDLRRLAAKQLATLPGRDATQALLRALDDPEAAVRLTAIRSLGQRRSRAALPRLEELRARDTLPSDEAEAIGQAIQQIRVGE